MVKYQDLFAKLENYDKIYITQFYRSEIIGKQIVVEDLGFSYDYIHRGSLNYVYRLASRYSDKLVLEPGFHAIVVDGASTFDLGVSLYILNKIYNENLDVELVLLALTPSLEIDDTYKAYYYSWFKQISLYDILFNTRRYGSFKYVLIDRSTPIQFCLHFLKHMDKLLSGKSSLVSIFYKRYIIPIIEVTYLLELLGIKAKYLNIVDEYKTILMTLSGILDIATGRYESLWSIARENRGLITGSGFLFKKYSGVFNDIDSVIEDLARVFLKKGKYTDLLVDPGLIIEKLLSGYTLRKLYDEINISEKIDILMNIDTLDLVKVYSYSVFKEYVDKNRIVIVSPDIETYISKGVNIIVDSESTGLISIIDLYTIPINSYCRLNTDYIPFEFYEAYVDKAGLALKQLYPPEIVIVNKVLKPEDIHSMGLVNYHGFIKCRESSVFYNAIRDVIPVE